jgi:hypothetical protein
MYQKKFLAIGGAVAALAACAAIVTAPAAAATVGTTVTVRVEGLNRTLLATKTVKTHGGWITKGGTPVGQCRATSAAGALDVATKGRWGGTFSSGLGIEVLSILGEKHPFTPPKYFWGLWINNRFASLGACALKLRKGTQLLFGAISDTASADNALLLRAPSHVTAGHAFTVKVTYLPPKGLAKPVAGARVGGAVTNSQGIATLTAHNKGTLFLRATKRPFIRSVFARLAVS